MLAVTEPGLSGCSQDEAPCRDSGTPFSPAQNLPDLHCSLHVPTCSLGAELRVTSPGLLCSFQHLPPRSQH